MKRPTLIDACNALTERKQSVGVPSPDEIRGGAEVLTAGSTPQLLIGLDLDAAELERVGRTVGLFGMRYVQVTGDPMLGLTSMWIDGVITGLILADMRERADQ